MRATGPEQKPYAYLERLVEALLEPMARRARQQALGLRQAVSRRGAEPGLCDGTPRNAGETGWKVVAGGCEIELLGGRCHTLTLPSTVVPVAVAVSPTQRQGRLGYPR